MFKGNKINFVTQYKYLGTIVNNHLNLNKNFNHSYKRANIRLRVLERLRQFLTVGANIKVYFSMIVPIMRHSSTIEILCNDTQFRKLQSLDHRLNSILKSTVTSISSCLNCDIHMLVKRCLVNKSNLDTFDNYFEIFDHKMKTRNNNHSIRLPRVKLEIAAHRFFFPGDILYNPLPLELRQIGDILLFKRRLKEHFK